MSRSIAHRLLNVQISKQRTRGLIQARFPIRRDLSRRARYRLADRMTMRRRQGHSPYHLFALVIPEPILAGLEAGGDWVSGRLSMLRGMLVGRTITTANVPAFRATAKMKPPCMRFRTLHAAGSTGL